MYHTHPHTHKTPLEITMTIFGDLFSVMVGKIVPGFAAVHSRVISNRMFFSEAAGGAAASYTTVRVKFL